MPVREDPTQAQQHLAMILSFAREGAGLTQAQVAKAASIKEASTIGRYEACERHPSARTAAEIMRACGQPEEAVEEAARIAIIGKQPSWWHPFRRGIPIWLQPYMRLEASACTMLIFDGVPGLLQIEDYVRALIDTPAHRISAQEVEEHIQLRLGVRLGRQKIITSDNPPDLWIILDQLALLRPVGGADVMHRQIKNLLNASDLPNVHMQVLPLSKSAAAVDGPVTIFRLPPPEKFPHLVPKPVAYAENRLGATYIEGEEQIKPVAEAFGELMAESLGAEESRTLLHKIAKDYS